MSILDSINSIKRDFNNIDITNYSNAKVFIEEFSSFINTIEKKLSQAAVMHQISVHVSGPYGASRWVILKSQNDDHNELQAGEWQASATSC